MEAHIHNLIISSIKRSTNNTAGAVTRDVENNVENLSENVVNKLTRLFNGGSLRVGGFVEEPDVSAFSQQIRNFLNEDSLEFERFREFGDRLARLLALQLNTGQAQNARDGFLITYYYSTSNPEDSNDEGSKYLCVVFLHRIEGTDIDDEELTFEDIERINLDSLNLGAKICIDSYLNDPQSRPISFKIGRGSDVSRFFKSFLGCDEPYDSKDDTYRLREAIEAVGSRLSLDKAQIEELCGNAKSYCSERLVAGDSSINLEYLAYYLFPDEESKNLFISVAHEEYRLGEIVGIDRAELNKYTSFHVKTSDYTLKFKTSALSQSVDWNPNDQTLTFRDLPESIIEKIVNYLPSSE